MSEADVGRDAIAAADGVVASRRALQAARARELGQRLADWLGPLTGSERVLDAGCGTGAFAEAVAPHVGEVIGVDESEAFVAAANEALGSLSVCFMVGDARVLGFPSGSFDLAGCLRVLHHTDDPARVVSELVRVVRPGGVVVVVDQLAHLEAETAQRIDRFEHARDATHSRLLRSVEIVSLLERSGARVERTDTTAEIRDVEAFLDLAGLAGDDRERVRALAPGDTYPVEIGWFLARRPLEER